MRTFRRLPSFPWAAGLALAAVLCIAAVPAARADVNLAILPSPHTVEPGEIFDVELTITEAGAPFNGYDAVVGFDPDVLTFIQLSQAEQEGPLMTEACGNRFHVFNSSPEGDVLNISHVLLCAGVTVTGPGVVYRLRFQAGSQETTTQISLLDGTAFYNGGLFVLPVFTQDAQIQIGTGTDVAPTLLVDALNLRAAPNPFNPRTTVSFDVAEPARARLAVYSTDGRLVRQLLDARVAAGMQSVAWDGRDATGQLAGSGVYLLRLDVDGTRTGRTITLLK